MTATVFDAFVKLHVLAGFLGLASFWIPVVAKKGGRLHIQAGWVFAISMLAAAISAVLISLWTLMDPVGTQPEASGAAVERLLYFNGLFLGYLGLLAGLSARTGLLAVQRKKAHERYRNPTDIGLSILLFVVAALVLLVGIERSEPSFIGMSVVGLMLGPVNLLFILRDPTDRLTWLYAHFGGMIGGGIAAHTAFLAFGANQLLPNIFDSVLVWVMPSVVGSAAISLLITRYKRKQRSSIDRKMDLADQL